MTSEGRGNSTSTVGENCPQCLGWRGAHAITCPTQRRICRHCGEWIEPVVTGGWRHVGGIVRCEPTDAEPRLTIREHAGMDPLPGVRHG